MVLNHLYFWDFHSEKNLHDKACLTQLHLATSLFKFDTFVLQFVLHFVFLFFVINSIPTVSMILKFLYCNSLVLSIPTVSIILVGFL